MCYFRYLSMPYLILCNNFSKPYLQIYGVVKSKDFLR